MKKRLINFSLIGALLLSSMLSFVGCKDYDDDIKSLQEQITKNANAIAEINKIVADGAIVTNVTSDNNGGLLIETTKGNHTITGGNLGSIVWTIGDDGYWYNNGVKTDKPSKGADGTGGAGVYYAPDVDETSATYGYWVKVNADGSREATNISWVNSGSTGQINAVWAEDLFGALIIDDGNGNVFTVYLTVDLRSMVFVPQAYYRGIPAIDFSTFRYYPVNISTEETATGEVLIYPEVLAEYKLNPASVTKDKIDTESLDFDYLPRLNYYETRATDIKRPKAIFKSIEDGTLTVKVDLDITGLSYAMDEPLEGDENKVDVMALQVTSSQQETITSDYATLYRTMKEVIAIAQPYSTTATTGALANVGATEIDYDYSKRFVDAKAVLPEAQLVYNESLDLTKLVETHYRVPVREADGTISGYYHSLFTQKELDAYGLEYRFSVVTNWEYLLPDESGSPTDQQKFAYLEADGKTLRAKVYDQIVTDPIAAVGRTPIVRATLVDTEKNEQVALLGYIKVKIIDAPTKPQIVNITVEVDQVAECLSQVASTTAEQMNTLLYQAVKINKNNFHLMYPTRLVETEYDKVTFGATTLHVYESVDEAANQSYDIQWNLSNKNIWEDTDENNEIKGILYFNSINPSENGKITVNYTVKVRRPAAPTMAPKSASYWFDGQVLGKLNVAVPANPTDVAANCIFVSNLNTLFVTSRQTSLVNNTWNILGTIDQQNIPTWVPTVQLPDAADYYEQDYYWQRKTTEYRFTEKNNGEFAGYNIYVSGNRKELWSTSENTWIARIYAAVQEPATVQEYVGYDIWVNNIEYNENSTVAKAILSTNEFTAEIEAYNDFCGRYSKITNGIFDVKFIRPLYVKTNTDKFFIDGLDIQDTQNTLNIRDIVSIYDWREKTVTDIPTMQYWNYYGVTRVGLDGSKDILSNVDNPALTGEKDFVKVPGTLEITEGVGLNGYPTVHYANKGNSTDTTFYIKLPIVIEYKWGRVQEYVTIPVKPTSGIL